MKPLKRFLAVLLTGMMTLLILGGCGGGASNPVSYPPNETIQTAVSAILAENGLTPSDYEEASSDLFEKYAVQISQSPESYLSYDADSPLRDLYTQWAADLPNIFPPQWSQWYIFRNIVPLLGNLSEAEALSQYKDITTSSLQYFNEYIKDNNLSGTSYYFVYPVHIANPSNPDDSVWMMFEILYLVEDE